MTLCISLDTSDWPETRYVAWLWRPFRATRHVPVAYPIPRDNGEALAEIRAKLEGGSP